jgi:hypothetical protein
MAPTGKSLLQQLGKGHQNEAETSNDPFQVCDYLILLDSGQSTTLAVLWNTISK